MIRGSSFARRAGEFIGNPRFRCAAYLGAVWSVVLILKMSASVHQIGLNLMLLRELKIPLLELGILALGLVFGVLTYTKP